MSGQRRGRWPNIETASGKCFQGFGQHPPHERSPVWRHESWAIALLLELSNKQNCDCKGPRGLQGTEITAVSDHMSRLKIKQTTRRPQLYTAHPAVQEKKLILHRFFFDRKKSKSVTNNSIWVILRALEINHIGACAYNRDMMASWLKGRGWFKWIKNIITRNKILAKSVSERSPCMMYHLIHLTILRRFSCTV